MESTAAPGLGLSIINLERKTLPGPEYLHDLINWSCTSVDAIEFWSASGDICRLSYKALDEQTSILADQILKTLGSVKDDREDIIVPVLISQSPELYISWIAVLKAGAAFCPVAIDVPAERLKFILKDVSASLVLTTHQHEKLLATIAPKIRVLSISQSTLGSSVCASSRRGSDKHRDIRLRPESLAYVMYTSGQFYLN
jgi:ferricrocin synthase